MPTPSSEDATLICFDGAWSDEDRALVRRAIGRLETPGLAAPAASSLAWHCVCLVGPSGTFYFAHWLRRPLVLTARTAEELVDEIEALHLGAAAS